MGTQQVRARTRHTAHTHTAHAHTMRPSYLGAAGDGQWMFREHDTRPVAPLSRRAVLASDAHRRPRRDIQWREVLASTRFRRSYVVAWQLDRMACRIEHTSVTLCLLHLIGRFLPRCFLLLVRCQPTPKRCAHSSGLERYWRRMLAGSWMCRGVRRPHLDDCSLLVDGRNLRGTFTFRCHHTLRVTRSQLFARGRLCCE